MPLTLGYVILCFSCFQRIWFTFTRGSDGCGIVILGSQLGVKRKKFRLAIALQDPQHCRFNFYHDKCAVLRFKLSFVSVTVNVTSQTMTSMTAIFALMLAVALIHKNVRQNAAVTHWRLTSNS